MPEIAARAHVEALDELGKHHVRQHVGTPLSIALDDRGGGLIAARFDDKDAQKGNHEACSLIAMGWKPV
ncbi:hypothetical protein ACC674_38610, partial [Rhizobium ruizarguesonis]